MQTEKVNKKGGCGRSWYSKATAAEGNGRPTAKLAKFKFLSNPLSFGACNSLILLYKNTHSNLYVHAKCTCKILNTEQKKRGTEPSCSSKYCITEQMLLLWLEKTMLAPTWTISSLLILTITVRRTRWSVGRGVLRVVTQAYQGDEETRLTEPTYGWPTTLHSSPSYWANRAVHLYLFNGSALCSAMHFFSASPTSQNTCVS